MRDSEESEAQSRWSKAIKTTFSQAGTVKMIQKASSVRSVRRAVSVRGRRRSLVSQSSEDFFAPPRASLPALARNPFPAETWGTLATLGRQGSNDTIVEDNALDIEQTSSVTFDEFFTQAKK